MTSTFRILPSGARWLLLTASVFAGLAASAPAQGLVNLSARATTAAGADALTAGFVIAGEGSKRVLVRAAGPALAGFGVPGPLGAVRLELFRGPTSIAVNTGWDLGAEAAAVRLATQSAGIFAFAPGSGDAALVRELAPGDYTAQVTPGAGAAAAGVALVEIYDLEPGRGARLINLSARARARDAAETLIAGFVVTGETRNRMLVRGIGPALTQFGVAGALADARLEVFRGPMSLAYNDDWMANAQAGAIGDVARRAGAFPLVAAARDAAALVPGTAGEYTAHVTSGTGVGGIALIEVYDTAGITALPPARSFDLVGFGRVSGHQLAELTGGGVPRTDYDPATRTGNFWRIDDAAVAALGTRFTAELQAALSSDQPLVIELNTMLDLSRVAAPNTRGTAIAHPDLFAPGRTSGNVGTLTFGSNKTIYSAYGNGGFRRGTLSLPGSRNIILRNLAFRELWEWDDATRGEYDRNDWDYLSVTSLYNGPTVTSRAHHIWIDHCDFEKSYDGLFDLVHGSDLITVSWCRLAGVMSGETRRWVERQMGYLEANRASFPYYDALRATLSSEEILRRELFQMKGNLVGNSTSPDAQAHDRGYLNVTFHHNRYLAVDARMPRMRFGNAHVFNLLADSSAGRGLPGLSLAGVVPTSNAAVWVDRALFLDTRTPVSPFVGIETPGRVTVTGSANRDSVTGVDRGFGSLVGLTPFALFRWNVPAAEAGLGGWPAADPAVLPAGYFPPGRPAGDYVDSLETLEAVSAQMGVIVPANSAEAEELRRRLQVTTSSR